MSFIKYFQVQPGFQFRDGIFCEDNFHPDPGFINGYLELRKKEGRLYPDPVVLHLPDIPSTHQAAAEWDMRRRSAKRLRRYLQTRNFGNIIELGCGNGWLLHYLSNALPSDLCGIDINLPELKQAARLFGSGEQLKFVCSDIFSMSLDSLRADIFILAGSVQYFSSLENLLPRLLSLLNEQGEIHILDSPFYEASEIGKARERSHQYLQNLGYPRMQDHYFYHGWDSVRPFQYDLLYDPLSIINRLKRQVIADSPFPWIRISKVQA